MILEERTLEFGEFLPGAFKRAIGAFKSDLKNCINKKSRLFQYKESDIHFEGGFEIKEGRVQMVVVGIPYGENPVTLTGTLRHSPDKINQSKYVRDRKIECERGKIRVSCDITELPEDEAGKEIQYEECFEYIIRESIRVARTT